MAFKTIDEYAEQKYQNRFVLQNHGDSADVIFLYRSRKDAVIADVHYIKSPDFSGYVHCPGIGCPACAKGIRTQTKLFIPLYNIGTGNIEFFDRTDKFQPQLVNDVFKNYPDASNYVFRITRNGVAGDQNTRYAINVTGAVAGSGLPTYDDIMAMNNTKFPDLYDMIVKEMSVADMRSAIDSRATANDYGNSYGNSYGTYNADLQPYSATPRVQPTYSEPDLAIAPDINSNPETEEVGEVDF